jgi:hypothetical protein
MHRYAQLSWYHGHLPAVGQSYGFGICRVVGHIATDKATVDRYLSYISYKQYKEENPDKF